MSSNSLHGAFLRDFYDQYKSQNNESKYDFVTELNQLFGSKERSNKQRQITRRPGMEEVKKCILNSSYGPFIPLECEHLRGEIWQVLLNVYKRNQHVDSMEEFDRMLTRLSKLPRDPVLVKECEQMAELLENSNQMEKEKIQKKIETLLVWFLTTKSVKYISGMVHAVAPFFLLNLPLPTIYDCFYQYCVLYLPEFMTSNAEDLSMSLLSISVANQELSNEENNHNQSDINRKKDYDRTMERQCLLEQLLSYHDPELSHFLTQWFPDWTQLISTSVFFETTTKLFAIMPPQYFLFIMDQILLTREKSFGIFLIVSSLIANRQELLQFTSKQHVYSTLKEICFQEMLENDTSKVFQLQILTWMAAKLRQLTPRTYQCGLDSFAPKSSTRQVTDIAFQPEQKKLKEDVDMSEWLRKESRSMAGKIFWYHTASGKTQWEHPAEGITPPPMSFALPISIEEVASMSNGSSSSIHYFIVDCRGLRSSEELKCGRIPAAYTLDPSVFDSPDLIAKNLQAFEPIKNETHIVLVGDGIAMPLCLVEPSEDFKIKVRDAVRADRDRINQATLFFQKQGFKYVSILDGGFASWHAYMRDTPGQNPSELLGHDGEVCNYCRYDIWLQTGEDPLKNGPSSSGGSVTGGFFQRRKKKISMPATTSLPVNGGEGSDCIISTSTLSRDRSSSGSISSSSRASAELDDLFGMSSSNQMDGTRPSFSGATSSLSLAVSTSVRRSINSLPRGSMKTLKLKVSSKWSNTFHWPRKNSSTSATQSCFEGEDNNSSEKTQEENGEENQVEETSTKEEPQQKQEVPKPFIGVFTIDYSDDEEEEEINNQEVSDQHVASTMTASH